MAYLIVGDFVALSTGGLKGLESFPVRLTMFRMSEVCSDRSGYETKTLLTLIAPYALTARFAPRSKGKR